MTALTKSKALKTLIALALFTAVTAGLAYVLSPNYFRNPMNMSQEELEDYATWICSLDKPHAEYYLAKSFFFSARAKIEKQKVAAIIASKCRLELLQYSAIVHISTYEKGGGFGYSIAPCLALELLSCSGSANECLGGSNMFTNFGSSSFDNPFYNAVLTRLESLQKSGSVHDRVIMGNILGAMTRVPQWNYAKMQTSPGEVERRTRLITAYLTTKEPTAELIAAQDQLLVTIMRDRGGVNSFFAQNPTLIKGAVGDACINLLENWKTPARAELAMQLMQALWRLENSRNPKKRQDLKQHEALPSALDAAISSVFQEGSPQQQADLRKVMLAEIPPEKMDEADVRAMEENILHGLTELSPETLKILTMGGQRTPSAQLKEKILTGSVDADQTTLLAQVPQWGDVLSSAMAANVHGESILAVYHALRRRDRAKPVLPWHRQAVDGLFAIVKDRQVSSTLRGYAARLLVMTFDKDKQLVQESIQTELEALVMLQEHSGKEVPPQTDWMVATEILRLLHLLNPKTSVYRDYLQHYEILPLEYKCSAARSAVQAPLAPGAAEYWIKAYTDQELRNLKNLRGGDLIHESTSSIRVEFKLKESKRLRETVEKYVEDKGDRKAILRVWAAQKRDGKK